jgi:hypothetical protein
LRFLSFVTANSLRNLKFKKPHLDYVASGQAGADVDLDGDSVVYPRSEYLRQFCARCWRDPDADHDQHEQVERRIVAGRIAAGA